LADIRREFMMRKSLISILFGLAAGFALRESSRRSSRQTAAPVSGRMGSSAQLMRRIAGLENALGDLQLGLERLGAENSRQAGSLREWVEERLAAMDDHPAQAEARQGDGAGGRLENRLQQHAEAIQQLGDRVVRLERSNRDLGLRLEQLQSPAHRPKALSA
jgi:TolA-binding protein